MSSTSKRKTTKPEFGKACSARMHTFLVLYQVEKQWKEKENKKPRRKIEWLATDFFYRKSNFTRNLSHIVFEPNPGIFRGEPLRIIGLVVCFSISIY